MKYKPNLFLILIIQTKTVETLNVGERLVELGFAKASVPLNVKKNTAESQLVPGLLSAEARAKSYRNGIWSDQLPPIPVYVVYWRKGSQLSKDLTILTAKKLLYLLTFTTRNALAGVKYLALRPFRSSPKPIQSSWKHLSIWDEIVKTSS